MIYSKSSKHNIIFVYSDLLSCWYKMHVFDFFLCLFHVTVDCLKNCITDIKLQSIFKYWSNFPINPMSGRLVTLKLMLWRAIKARDKVVTNSGQGIYWQGSDKSPPTS